MKMRAVGIETFGEESVLKELDLPVPLPRQREVRIKILSAGFNPVDVKIRQGKLGTRPFPLVLGADCSGVIDAVGSPGGEFEVGDEVCALSFGQGSNGTYAEYVVLPQAFVVKKPRNLSFEEAAAVPLTSLTAFQALIASGALQRERPLFIAGGGGGVGSVAIPLARCFHAGPIFTTAGGKESSRYLTEELHIPREQILYYRNLSLDEMERRLLALNGGERFPCTFDAVGGEMKSLCLRATDYQGHFATIVPESDSFQLNIWGRSESPSFARSLSLHFIFVGAAALSPHIKDWSVYKAQLKEIVKLLEEKRLPPPSIEVMGPLSVETIQAAHRKLASGRTIGKLVLR